jgi:predicted phosphodiesterase
MRQRMSAVDPHLTRIIVTHHPFDLPDTFDKDDLVDRAPMAMQAFAECGVDLLLAGHLHASHAGNSSERYKISGYAALVVQAGTATSTRGRGESNSFNVIRVEPDMVQVERYSWVPGTASFEIAHTERFRRTGDVWSLAGES